MKNQSILQFPSRPCPSMAQFRSEVAEELEDMFAQPDQNPGEYLDLVVVEKLITHYRMCPCWAADTDSNQPTEVYRLNDGYLCLSASGYYLDRRGHFTGSASDFYPSR